jgi:hypothetical protein
VPLLVLLKNNYLLVKVTLSQPPRKLAPQLDSS